MFKKLIDWSEKNFSHLPWRKGRTLYTTLVSEIMLQQTTVGTVLNKFDDFIKEFPTPAHVAKASETQMLNAWKGLGYYRRAKNLKKACEFITDELQGEIPLDFDLLKSIPGIGDYTANAILAIGADKKAIALDANLERVIARLYGIDAVKGPKLIKIIYQLFNDGEIFKKFRGSYRSLNEALMDLGRNHCQLRKTNCELCFLRKECVAYKENKALEYPKVNVQKTKEAFELELYRIVVIKNNKVLAYKKNIGEWLEGQYELPTLIKKCTDKNLKQYPNTTKKFKSTLSIKTSITKYKIINHIVTLDEIKFDRSLKWLSLDSKELSTASTKVLKEIRKKRD